MKRARLNLSLKNYQKAIDDLNFAETINREQIDKETSLLFYLNHIIIL